MTQENKERPHNPKLYATYGGYESVNLKYKNCIAIVMVRCVLVNWQHQCTISLFVPWTSDTMVNSNGTNSTD